MPVKRASIVGSVVVLSFVATQWLPLIERAAQAQPHAATMAETKQRAIQLADEAYKEMVQGDFESSCKKFAASFDLYSDQRTLVNRSACYEHINNFLGARAGYTQALERAASHPIPPRRDIEKLLAALSAQIPTLTVNVTSSALFAVSSIDVDGSPLAKEQWGKPVEMNPGPHEVVAKSSRGSVIWRTPKESLKLNPRRHEVVTIPGFTPETVKQVERLWELSAAGNKAIEEGKIEELCSSIEEYIKIHNTLPAELRDIASEEEKAQSKRMCDSWPDKRAASLIGQATRVFESVKKGSPDALDKLKLGCSMVEEAVKRREEVEWLHGLGSCRRTLGNTASADRALARGLELAIQQKDEAREAAIKKDRADLAPHLSSVTIRITKEIDGMSVTLRSVALGASWVLPRSNWGKKFIVDPGSYEIVVATRETSWNKSVTVGPDGASEIVELPPPADELAHVEPLLRPDDTDLATVPPGVGACACDALGVGAHRSAPAWTATAGLALVLFIRRRRSVL